jgi:ParB family transcriptional regulator, chromosome partitioning protein
VARRKATQRGKSRSKNAPRRTRPRLQPRAEERGLDPARTRIAHDAVELDGLAAEIEAAGGAALGAYREPFSGRALLLAVVPLRAVRPTPFQRDLSPAHTQRLAQKIEETGSFLDPILAVRGDDGGLWTPNGRHRLAAAKLLGLKLITVLASPDAALAYRILALNTEKAHNLRDKSLEAIRMARSLAARDRRACERDYAQQLESPELLTLGIAYEQKGRFAGSAYHPLLRRVDRFSERTLAVSIREREGYAARLLDIDALVAQKIGELQAAGFRSPYLRALVVARINPLRAAPGRARSRAPAMSLAAALTRMAAGVRRFDPSSVRPSDLALAAALAPDAT